MATLSFKSNELCLYLEPSTATNFQNFSLQCKLSILDTTGNVMESKINYT